MTIRSLALTARGGVLLPFTLALLLGTCREAPTGTAGHRASLAVQPAFDRQVDLAAFNLVLDSLRVVVARPPSEILVDTTVFFHPDSSEVRLELRVALRASVEILEVTLELRGGGVPLFSGTQEVEVTEGPPGTTPPPIIPVSFVGPGSNLTQLVVTPEDSVVSLNDSLAMRVKAFDASGLAVPQFFVAWSVTDPAASINASGLLRAPDVRGVTSVLVSSPNGVVDSTPVTFIPAPTALQAVSPLTGTVGSQVQLAVEVLADDQQGVKGIPVEFVAVSGGGSVGASPVISDANGVAQTTATLGTATGTQVFEARASGLPPLQLPMSAVAAAPAVLVYRASPSGATAGEVIDPPVEVEIEDEFGNAVETATSSVTVAIGDNPGDATLGGTTTRAAVAGVATFDDLTVSAPGLGYTLVATSTDLTPDTTAAFTAIGPGNLIAWTNTGGGLWSDPGNWDLARVPTSTDTVFIAAAGTYTVTLDVSPTIEGVSLGGTSGTQTLAVPDTQTLTLGSGAEINQTGVLHVSGGNLTVDGGHSLDLNGGTVRVDTGRVLLIGSGDPSRLTYRGGTFSGGGALAFSAGASLDLEATLSLDGIFLFLNDATVDRLVSERLIVGSSGLVVMQATSGVTINTIVENSGVVIARGIGNVVNDSLINSLESGLQVEGIAGNTALEVANGLLNHGGIVLTSSVADAGATLQVTSGTLRNESDGIILSAAGSGGARTLAAELDNRGLLGVQQALVLDRASAAHVNTGQIQLATGSLTVTQSADNPSFTNRASILVAAGQTLLVTGGTFVNDVSPTEGVIAGTGTVDVTGTSFSNLGFISPGVSPGVLTWQGDVPFGTSAGLTIELGGTTVGTGHDQLNASDFTATLDGTLDVQLFGGFTPLAGDSFQILTFGSREGSFTATSGLDLGGGLVLDTIWSPTDLALVARQVIPLDAGPIDLALSRPSIRVYALAVPGGAKRSATPSVVTIDAMVNQPIDTVPLDAQNAYAVSVNTTNEKLYVSDFLAGLIVVDGSVGEIRTQLSITEPGFTAIDESANRIYLPATVPASLESTVPALLTVDGTVDTVLADTVHIGGLGQLAFGVAFNPNDGLVYAAVYADPGFVKIVDPGQMAMVDSIAVPGEPFAMAINPATNKLYVTSDVDNAVTVVDLTSRTALATIPIGGYNPNLTVDVGSNRIYATNFDSSTVTIIDGTTDGVINVLQAGATTDGAYDAVVSPVNGALYVARFNVGEITIMRQ